MGFPLGRERRHITSASNRIFRVRNTVALETSDKSSATCYAVNPSDVPWM